MAEDHRGEHAAGRDREDHQLEQERDREQRAAGPGQGAEHQRRPGGEQPGGGDPRGAVAPCERDDVDGGDPVKAASAMRRGLVEGRVDPDRRAGRGDRQRLVGEDGEDAEDDRAGRGEGEEPAGRVGPQPGEDDRRERPDRQAGQDRPVDEREVLRDSFRRHRPSVAEEPANAVWGSSRDWPARPRVPPFLHAATRKAIIGASEDANGRSAAGMEVRPDATARRRDIHLVRPLLLGGGHARAARRSSSIRGSAIRCSPKGADQVDRCDLLLVTHGHGDHFGDALLVASRTRPAWPCIHEMSLWLGRNYAHKDTLIGMNKGGTVEAAGIKVTMVRADHSSGELYGEAESPIHLGEPVGFIVELEDGFRFYFAGDTDVFGDMRLIGERYRPSTRLPADRRPLHDGSRGGGARRRAPRRRTTSRRCTTGPSRSWRARRTSSVPRWRLAVSAASRSTWPSPAAGSPEGVPPRAVRGAVRHRPADRFRAVEAGPVEFAPDIRGPGHDEAAIPAGRG